MKKFLSYFHIRYEKYQGKRGHVYLDYPRIGSGKWSYKIYSFITSIEYRFNKVLDW